MTKKDVLSSLETAVVVVDTVENSLKSRYQQGLSDGGSHSEGSHVSDFGRKSLRQAESKRLDPLALQLPCLL